MKNKVIIRPVACFDNSKIALYEVGHTVIETVIKEESLNIRGNAHGGVIFTICDTVAGNTARSYDVDVVTQAASINYLAAVPIGTKIVGEGKCVHSGESTKIIHVDMKDDNGKLFATAVFTMFVLK